MKTALMTAISMIVALGPEAHAANANNPYGNVDHRVDAGNDTGDSQVDRLNDQQLNRNYRGPYYPAVPVRPLPPRFVAPPYAVPAPYAGPGYPPPPPPYYTRPGYPRY